MSFFKSEQIAFRMCPIIMDHPVYSTGPLTLGHRVHDRLKSLSGSHDPPIKPADWFKVFYLLGLSIYVNGALNRIARKDLFDEISDPLEPNNPYFRLILLIMSIIVIITMSI